MWHASFLPGVQEQNTARGARFLLSFNMYLILAQTDQVLTDFGICPNNNSSTAGRSIHRISFIELDLYIVVVVVVVLTVTHCDVGEKVRVPVLMIHRRSGTGVCARRNSDAVRKTL